MFAKRIIALFASAVLVMAIPTSHDGGGSTTVVQCNTGSAQCCNTLQSANDPSVEKFLGLLGIVLGNVDAQIGLGCTPVSVIGVSQGANCAQQPVCCENNNFNGLVNVGCNPISI